MLAVVRFRPRVAGALLLLASCGSTSTTTPTTIPATTTTSMAPARLTLADVDRVIGTPEDMQNRGFASSGDYVFAATREIRSADAAALFVEAQGIVQAFSRRMTMEHIYYDDPMSTHPARAIVRIIIFDSAEKAGEATRRQGNSFDPNGTAARGGNSFTNRHDGVRRAGRWNVRVGGDLPCLHEGLSQHGRVVTWMVMRNKNCSGMTETAPALRADDFAQAVVDRHPQFAE